MSAMSRAAEGSEFTLRIGDNDAATVRFVNPEDVERILALLKRGAASISLTPREDMDTEGHGAGDELVLDARFGDDDVEGHAIALRFPSAKDARDFQMKILAAGLLAGTIVVAGLGATAAPFASTDIGSASAPSGAAGLVDQRAGEIGLGSITSPSSGIADHRAGEIGLGSVVAPGSGAGVAEHRAGEIGLGSVAAPGSGAGLAEQRAGEIGLGSVTAPGGGAGLAEHRAGEIGLGSTAAPGSGAGISEHRAGEINEGGATSAAGLADQRAGEINAGSNTDEPDETNPTSPGTFRGR